MLAALHARRAVGIVADRDLSGGGMPVELFGAPASLPIGPALLAVETGTPMFAVAIRRSGRSRYIGELVPVDLPSTGARRDRVLAALHGGGARLRAPHRAGARPVVERLLPDLARPRGRRRAGTATPDSAA